MRLSPADSIAEGQRILDEYLAKKSAERAKQKEESDRFWAEYADQLAKQPEHQGGSSHNHNRKKLQKVFRLW
jgi:hypothetical protein